MKLELNHFDENGNAIMVDVSEKKDTVRKAQAKGRIYVSETILAAICCHTVTKGDVLGVARVAGIMAAKNTSRLIPMCHPLALTQLSVDFEVLQELHAIEASCTAGLKGKTGVEMEVLTGVSVALLTIYDMCKAIDKGMKIGEIHLVSKSGGKSGNYLYTDACGN